MPLRGERPIDARGRDLEGVRAPDEVLVAVQLVGSGPGKLGDVVQPDARIGIDDDLDGVRGCLDPICLGGRRRGVVDGVLIQQDEGDFGTPADSAV